MYITPNPMSPDTFSQYGYADATKLRALRRGYGHDIYPQYPTTYNMPRVVAGLGAFTKDNYTIPYYADPGSLSFADKNMKKLYEGLRNADADFQINLFKIKKAIEPVFGAIEFASAGKIRAEDIKKALSLKLPTWGVALVLEVAAGKRPLDKGFKSVMKECAKDMGAAKAAFAVLTGLDSTLVAASVVPSPVMPIALAALPVTGPIAGMAVTATTVSSILEPIFDALGKGKAPSKKQMKDMMEGAARLSGQKLPSSADIDKVAGSFDKAVKENATAFQQTAAEYDKEFDDRVKATKLLMVGAPDKAIRAIVEKQMGKRPDDNPSGLNAAMLAKQRAIAEKQKQTSPTDSDGPADTSPTQKVTAEGGFPVVPALLAAGALAAVVLVARKRGKK